MKRQVVSIFDAGQGFKYGQQDKSFFSEFESGETFRIPSNMPDIDHIVSIVAEPEILSLRVIDTMKGVSAEGQNLTGKAVAAEIKLKQKILYAGDLAGQAIHVIFREAIHSIYVVIPALIEGTDPESLVKYKLLKPRATIEDANAEKVGSRTVFRSVTILMELYFVPTYEICCCLHNDRSSSQIFICHQDGTNNLQITPEGNRKYMDVKWSPGGQEIAYISHHEGSKALFVINPRSSAVRLITDTSEFKSVNSYCWSADGLGIIFSSLTGGYRELFSLDLCNLKCKQLTHSNLAVNSYKPKCSPCGDKIAFFRSINEVAYLYIMNNNGLECRVLSKSTGIKDFDWCRDGKKIAYIRSNAGRPEELCIIDMKYNEEYILTLCDSVIQKRNVQFSPDGAFVSFIGSDLITENVYVYTLEKDELKNITHNNKNSHVSDYVWKIDSKKIYFTNNELSYYCIYSLSLESGERNQLTSFVSSNIELSYRPKIR